MNSVNPDNERIKRRYFYWLREGDSRSEKTINLARLALAKWDRFTDAKDYRRFKPADAVAFKKALLAGGGRRSAELSSRSSGTPSARAIACSSPSFASRLPFSSTDSVAAGAGCLVLAVSQQLGLNVVAASAIGILVTAVIRLLAVIFDISLPEQRALYRRKVAVETSTIPIVKP